MNRRIDIRIDCVEHVVAKTECIKEDTKEDSVVKAKGNTYTDLWESAKSQMGHVKAKSLEHRQERDDTGDDTGGQTRGQTVLMRKLLYADGNFEQEQTLTAAHLLLLNGTMFVHLPLTLVPALASSLNMLINHYNSLSPLVSSAGYPRSTTRISEGALPLIHTPCNREPKPRTSTSQMSLQIMQHCMDDRLRWDGERERWDGDLGRWEAERTHFCAVGKGQSIVIVELKVLHPPLTSPFPCPSDILP